MVYVEQFCFIVTGYYTVVPVVVATLPIFFIQLVHEIIMQTAKQSGRNQSQHECTHCIRFLF